MSRAKAQASAPATLATLLPALRMMVRFPTRPVTVVSFETAVELSDLRAWIEENGRPTAKSLAKLEAEVEGPIRGNRKGCQVKVPAEVPEVRVQPLGGLAASPPPREIGALKPAAKAVVPAAKPAAAETAPAAVAMAPSVAPERRWLKRRAWIGIVRQYLPAIEAWVADATLPQSEVCRRIGMRIGTFSAWKIATFGPMLGYGHRPPEAEMRAWLEWARERVAATAASGGREFGPPPAARANAITAPEPAVAKVAPVCSLADLSGKERRHLVASVACGLLAGRSGEGAFVGEVVARAYEVVAEIVRQDAAHSAPNGAEARTP